MLVSDKEAAVQEKELYGLFYTLSATGVSLEEKITQLREYEDFLLRRDTCWVREAKLALLRDLFWLVYEDELDTLEKALKDRKKLSQGDGMDRLVKAADSALGGISDGEASEIMDILRLMKADSMGIQELPFV